MSIVQHIPYLGNDIVFVAVTKEFLNHEVADHLFITLLDIIGQFPKQFVVKTPIVFRLIEVVIHQCIKNTSEITFWVAESFFCFHIIVYLLFPILSSFLVYNQIARVFSQKFCHIFILPLNIPFL